jgi:hypothetical protein
MATFITDDGEQADVPEDAITLTLGQALNLDQSTLAFVQDWLYRAARQFTDEVEDKYLDALPEAGPTVRVSGEVDQLIGGIVGMENMLAELNAVVQVAQQSRFILENGLAGEDEVLYATIARVPDPSEPLFTTVEAV